VEREIRDLVRQMSSANPLCGLMGWTQPSLFYAASREILSEMSERLRLFEERLRRYDLRITELARADERAVRLIAVEGVGPLTATAMIAAVGDARQFRSGRELSAWLGVVPRQHSSGERTVLLGISNDPFTSGHHNRRHTTSPS
jgi:transposase